MRALAARPLTAAVALVAAGAVAAPPAGRVSVPAPEVSALIQLVSAADDITIDFIRHGLSTDNVSGVLGTTPPGALLVDPTGQQQAIDVGQSLYDSGTIGGSAHVYASELLRTQQTAWPLLQLLAGNPAPGAGDIPTDPTVLGAAFDSGHILSGLNEVNAGLLEGTNLGQFGQILYIAAPLMWTLGLQFVPQWGSSIDPNGMAFDQRFDGAIDTIYDNSTPGSTDAAFSHAAAIMIWSQMNVDNPNPLLILTDPLDNTGEVQVVGNPTDGWVMTEWNGTPVDPVPNLWQDLFVNTRDLIVAPQTAGWDIWQALLTFDPETIFGAVKDGFVNVVQTTLNYPVAMISDIIGAITGDVPLGLDALGGLGDLSALGLDGLLPVEIGALVADVFTAI